MDVFVGGMFSAPRPEKRRTCLVHYPRAVTFAQSDAISAWAGVKTWFPKPLGGCGRGSNPLCKPESLSSCRGGVVAAGSLRYRLVCEVLFNVVIPAGGGFSAREGRNSSEVCSDPRALTHSLNDSDIQTSD